MDYYIQVPFGASGVRGHRDEPDVTGAGEEVVRVKGVTFLRISGRQFDRVTKTFREQGWPHQITGIRDCDEDTVSDTLLLAPNPEFDTIINWISE